MGTVSFDFKGEVVIVTGGSRGLGLEIAHAFGYAGAQVVITARREQWLTEAEKFLKDRAISVYAMTCDVADASSVEQTVQQILERCGKIDVLVNNAGLTWGAPAESMPFDRWRQVIDANITGPLFLSRHKLLATNRPSHPASNHVSPIAVDLGSTRNGQMVRYC